MQYFGTDGIRGVVGQKLTLDLAARVGAAYGRALLELYPGGSILIGRDTRASGAALEEAISTSLASLGFAVVCAGVLTTPAHSFLTKSGDFVGGVMITASHNPASHNGIKLCDRDGKKYSIDFLENVESMLYEDVPASHCRIKRNVVYDTSLGQKWIDFVLDQLGQPDLGEYKVALDLANGAGFDLIPRGFGATGATVLAYNTESDGANINNNCGSLYVDRFVDTVLGCGADIGFSFDGDADRIMVVDRYGTIVDGTDLMYIFGRYYAERGMLVKDAVVSTIITNMGLESSLARYGINLRRTAVGGQHVQREMDAGGYVVGGEENGHMMLADIGEGSDGMCIGLYLLKIMREKNCDLRDLLADLVRTHAAKSDLNVTEEQKRLVGEGHIDDFVREQEARLGDAGRIIVRTSGTECVVRVLVEGEDQPLLEKICAAISDHVLGL